jgi:magnesium chelatase family protein
VAVATEYRVDLMINVPAVNAADLLLPPAAEGSVEVAARVAAARSTQAKRYGDLGLPRVFTNAAAPGAVIEEVARPDPAGMSLLRDASERLNLSARGFHRVLKLARTIADLDGATTVGRAHLAEALSYRISGAQELRAA